MTSSISQGSVPSGNTPIIPGADTEEADRLKRTNNDGVNRGFSSQNSASTAPNQDDDLGSYVNSVRIDPPADGADSPPEDVLKELEMLRHLGSFFQTDGEGRRIISPEQLLGDLGSEIMGSALNRINPLASHSAAIEANRERLVALGFSEELINDLLALADPENPESSLENMHSFSSRFAGRLQGDPALQELYDTFGDILGRIAALENGPPELIAELENSLKAFASQHLNGGELDPDAAAFMLMQIQTKLQDERMVFSQETIRDLQVSKAQHTEDRLNKITESMEKAKEAEKSGEIGKIFSYIALAIMAIVTAVVTVVTGGLAAGLMVAALVIMILMVASSESETNFMTNWFGEEGEMTMSIVWTAITAILTVGAGFAASAGAGASAAANAAAGGAKGAQVAATATTASSIASKTAKLSQIAAKLTRWGQITAGAAQVADGSASVVSTKHQYEADMLRAEAKEIYAFILRNQQKIDEFIEDIEKIIDELQQGHTTLTTIMKDNHDTKIKMLSYIRG